jgi:hypothetical protein
MSVYLNVSEVLRDAQERVAEVRKTLASVKPHFIGGSTDAVNMARQNVCDSLVRRLEIAEKEMRELEDMIATVTKIA